jgi:hypothetical protein
MATDSLEERFNRVSLEERFKKVADEPESLEDRFDNVASLEERFKDNIKPDKKGFPIFSLDELRQAGRELDEAVLGMFGRQQKQAHQKTLQELRQPEDVKYTGELDTPLIDPVEAVTMGTGFGLKTGLKAGLKGAKLIKPVAEEIVSEITLGAKDVPKIVKGAIKKISKAEESKAFVKMLDNHLNKIDPPKYAGSINLHRQQITDIAKQLELDTFKEFGETYKVTNKETIEKADRILTKFKSDPKFYETRIQAIKSGQTPTTAEELAHRVINATNQDNLAEAARKAANGEISVEDFNILQEQVRDIQLNVVNPMASEAGRRLQMYNIQVGKNRAFKAVAKLEKGLNKRQIKELSEIDFDDPYSVQRFVERLPDPKLRDYFYEYWYNSILSGIPTHVVNVASNALWGAFQLPHRALTAGVDKVISKFSKKQRNYFMSEIVPMMAGIPKGLKKGAQGAAEMMRTGEALEFRSKFNRDIGNGILSAMERSEFYKTKVGKKVINVITGPSRALQAMDIWANAMAYEMELGAIVERTIKQKGITGEIADNFRRQFLQNPSKEMMQEAAEFARYATFQDEPGKIAKKFLELREAIPGSRLIVPFVSTISNLTKRGVEMTPGLGLALRKGQTPAEVVAKQIEGSVITFILANKMANGEITGEAPQKKSEREAFYRQGKLPWSVKVGDNWVQYRRIEPFNTVLASVSQFYNNMIEENDDKNITEKFMKASQGVVMNLIDSTYMQGIQDLLNVNQSWESAGVRKLTSLVPFSGFWRSINRAVEAYGEGDAKVRETKDFLGAFSQVIPGLYKHKEPRLDVWGEDITIPGNFFRQWLPYKWATQTDDIVELTLEDIGYYPALPQQKSKIGMRTIEFTDTEYRDYVKESGRLGKQVLTQICESEGFQNADDEIKRKIIDQAFTKIRSQLLNKYKGIALSQEDMKKLNEE